MKFLIVAALVALVAAEPPVNYGAPGVSSSYGAPGVGATNGGNPNAGYGAPGGNNGGNNINSGYGAPGAGGRGGGASAPIESESNLELENEGLNLPSDIIGQDLLDRVVDVLSEDLAQQERQRQATSGAYGAPNPGYGPPPSTQYGPGGNSGNGNGGSNGRISLLIPPDPLKARLIANYIQRTSAPYTGSNGGPNGNSGYSNNQQGYN